MINAKPISQNPDRYRMSDSGWSVSASPDIKPLEFKFGNPPSDLKPVIEADGVIIDVGQALLCSKGTMKLIEGMGNPHYDVSVNGIVMVRDKGVKLGSTIPIIKIDLNRLPTIGDSRKLPNSKAGVDSVVYTYQGEEVMGVPKGIIDQLNYTLVEEINRPGDTFDYWKWIKDDNPNYNLAQLNVDTAQEDGKLDKNKLTTFVTTIGERLAALRKDFNSIKRTFFYGEVPSSADAYVDRMKNYTVNPDDDIVVHQYVEKTTTVVNTITPATQKTATEAAKPKPPTPPDGPVVANWWFEYMTGRTSLFGGKIPDPTKPGTKTIFQAGTLWEVDPSTTQFPKKLKTMYEGEAFWGHKVRDWTERGNNEIWKVFKEDGKTVIGWMDISGGNRIHRPIAVKK